MSTPNPTHIDVLAEGMREAATTGAREDGQLWGAFPNTMTLTDLAAHVVSKLTDAGYSIVETADLEDEKLTREAALGYARKWSDAAQAARKSEMHWPADCLMEAAAFVIGASAAAAEGEKQEPESNTTE